MSAWRQGVLEPEHDCDGVGREFSGEEVVLVGDEDPLSTAAVTAFQALAEGLRQRLDQEIGIAINCAPRLFRTHCGLFWAINQWWQQPCGWGQFGNRFHDPVSRSPRRFPGAAGCSTAQRPPEQAL